MNGYYKWDRSASPPQPYFIQAQSGGVVRGGAVGSLASRRAARVFVRDADRGRTRRFRRRWCPTPVFLPANKVARWIDGPWFPLRFLKRMPQPALEAYPVSRRIRSRDPDDYTLLDPVDPEEDAVASAGFGDEEEDEGE